MSNIFFLQVLGQSEELCRHILKNVDLKIYLYIKQNVLDNAVSVVVQVSLGTEIQTSAVFVSKKKVFS